MLKGNILARTTSASLWIFFFICGLRGLGGFGNGVSWIFLISCASSSSSSLGTSLGYFRSRS